MKWLISITLFFLVAHVYSQNNYDPLPKLNDRSKFLPTTYKFHAFVRQIRLDSIDAQYGRLEINASGVLFDYGQNYRKDNEIALRDSIGRLIDPSGISGSFALNLLAFNGWELIQVYYSKLSDRDNFIFKKILK